MLIKVIIPALLSSVCISFTECASMKQHHHDLFKVNAANYQSWVVSDNDKGTDILLTLNKVEDGVKFDSIIFRGVRLIAFVTKNKNEVSIKSILPSGIPRLKLESEVVNLPDQLIYHYDGVRKTYFLKSIKRKNIRFLLSSNPPK